jgi:hypothetical protein
VPTGESQRKFIFGLALAVLALGAVAMGFLGAGNDSRTGPSEVAKPRQAATGPSESDARSAAVSAARFLEAYLRYQEGELRAVDRRAIAHYSTPDFGEQLLRAPVRLLPGSRPPRQVVAKVTAVRAGLFDGQAALLAAVLIAGSTGTHLLRVTLVQLGERWVVSGVGP